MIFLISNIYVFFHKSGRNRYNFNNDSILSDYYFSRAIALFTVGVFRRRSSQRIFLPDDLWPVNRLKTPIDQVFALLISVGPISRSSIIRGIAPSIPGYYDLPFLQVCFFDCKLLAKRFLRILHEYLVDISFVHGIWFIFEKLFAPVRKFFSPYSCLFMKNLVCSVKNYIFY